MIESNRNKKINKDVGCICHDDAVYFMPEFATMLRLLQNGIFSGHRRACRIHLQLVILLNSHGMDQFTNYQLTNLAIFPSKIILHEAYKPNQQCGLLCNLNMHCSINNLLIMGNFLSKGIRKDDPPLNLSCFSVGSFVSVQHLPISLCYCLFHIYIYIYIYIYI